MTTKAGFALVLVLQVTTIALLLYVVFEQRNAAEYIDIPPAPVASGAALQSGNQFGPSDEDYPRWNDQSEDWKLASRSETSATGSREVRSIPDELRAEIKRYQTMSEQEKRQVEAELSKHIFGSEAVETLSKILNSADSTTGIPPDPVAPGAAAQSENRFGPPDEDLLQVEEDLLRLKEQFEGLEFKRSTSISRVFGSRELGSIPDELLAEIRRYQTMSEQEKRKVEAELSKHMVDSEVVETLSKVLNSVDATLEEFEVEQ